MLQGVGVPQKGHSCDYFYIFQYRDIILINSRYGRDGYNYTARAVFDCYYTEEDSSYVVIDYFPERWIGYFFLDLVLDLCAIINMKGGAHKLHNLFYGSDTRVVYNFGISV